MPNKQNQFKVLFFTPIFQYINFSNLQYITYLPTAPILNNKKPKKHKISKPKKRERKTTPANLSERPVTDVTDVGFLAGVSPPVTLEDVLLGEGHRTEVTLERSLLAVDSAVFLEVRLLKEPLAALRAHLITDL